MDRIAEIEEKVNNGLYYGVPLECYECIEAEADIRYLLARVKAAEALYEGVRNWIKNKPGVRNLAVVMYEYEAALKAVQDGE